MRVPRKTVPGKHSKVSVRIKSKNPYFALENWDVFAKSEVRRNKPLKPIIEKIQAKLGSKKRVLQPEFINVARSFGATTTEAILFWSALKKAEKNKK